MVGPRIEMEVCYPKIRQKECECGQEKVSLKLRIRHVTIALNLPSYETSVLPQSGKDHIPNTAQQFN